MPLMVFSKNTWKLYQGIYGTFHKCTNVFKQQSGLLLLYLMKIRICQHVLHTWHCHIHHLSFLQESYKGKYIFPFGDERPKALRISETRSSFASALELILRRPKIKLRVLPFEQKQELIFSLHPTPQTTN